MMPRDATALIERLTAETHAALAAVDAADPEALVAHLVTRHEIMQQLEAVIARHASRAVAGAGFHHAIGGPRAALGEALRNAQQQQLALMKAAARLRDRVADALAQIDRADVVANAYQAATAVGPSMVSVRR